jgi:outer membrane phospholipase A
MAMNKMLVALVLAGTVCRGAVAAEEGVSVLLAPAAEAGQGTAAGAARVWVVYLNTGPGAARVRLPETMPATVQAGGRVVEAQLRRAPEVGPERVVQPGAFLRVPYELAGAEGLAGEVVVKLKEAPGASAVVAVGNGTTATKAVVRADGAREAGPGESGRYSGADPTAGPAASPAARAPEEAGRAEPTGFVEAFARNFRPYEPMYFLVGTRPTAKFQYSFRYQVFDDGGSWAEAAPLITGLNFAYSQTSFWDLAGESRPFVDNSYRPEGLLSYDDVLPKSWDRPMGLSRLGLQTGLQHESNGAAGLDSRSLNVAYVRPIFVWEESREEDGFFVTFAPRLLAYVGNLSDNPDIREFRGYGDLRLVVGWRDGFQLAAVGRMGEDFDKGSLQVDLSHPLGRPTHGNLDLYLHAQFFTGFGETLIRYNESTTSFRVGVSLVR